MDDLDDYYTSSYNDDPAAAAAMTISDFRDEHGEDDGFDDVYGGRDDDDLVEGGGTAFNVTEGTMMMMIGASSDNPNEVILPLEGRQDIVDATGISIGDSYIGPDSFEEYGEMADSAGELLSLRSPATATAAAASSGEKQRTFEELVRKQARFSADVPSQTSKSRQPGGGAGGVDRFITGSARRTRPIMTKFEYAAIIGERATQIEAGATNIDSRVVTRAKAEKIDNALDIAELELETLEADFPLTVQRRIAPNLYEVWGVRELLLPSQILCTSYSREATRLLLGARGGDHCPHDVSKALTNSYKRFLLAENTA